MKYSRIHQFDIAAAQSEAALISAPLNSPVDEAHEDLFDQFRSAFHTHARRQFGLFDPEFADAALAGGISAYHGGELGAEGWDERLAECFRRSLGADAQPGRWFLWFVIEQRADVECVYLFLFQQEQSHHLRADLSVGSGNAINPARLQFGVKLDVAEWAAGESRAYLSFLAPRNQQPVTLAWNAMIGFSEGVDRKVQTETFLDAVERFAESLPPEKEHECRARVVDYCLDQERSGEPVEIRALSRHVDEAEPDAFARFLAEHVQEAPRELYPDRRQLKRYTRLYGRDQDLSISFSSVMLGRNIIYDERNDTLVIRAIPKALKQQLARHGKKTDEPR